MDTRVRVDHFPGLEHLLEATQVAVHLRLSAGDRLLADDRYDCTHNEIHRRIPLSDPGIDDAEKKIAYDLGRRLAETAVRMKAGAKALE